MIKKGTDYIVYILVKIVFYSLSILPLEVLYVLADGLAFIFRDVMKYRRKVIEKNISNAFPEYTKEQVVAVRDKFYKHLAELTFESVKAFTISKEEFIRRFKIENPEIIEDLYDKNISVIYSIAHYGNWDWIGLGSFFVSRHKPYGVYQPFKNPYLDAMMKKTRERFGLTLISTKKIKEFYDTLPQDLIISSGFMVDQVPGDPKKSHWITFLNQDTPALFGAEKLAATHQHAVVYTEVTKPKRGYYNVKLSVITENAALEKPYFVTETQMKSIEDCIRREPQYWLWSHNRWKYKKADYVK